MPVGHINIGSNIGDRLFFIEQAVIALKERLDPHLKVSSPFYSKPDGFISDNEFVNVGIMFRSHLDPFDLLRLLLDIQASVDPSSHRDEKGNYIDRKIDIDLITYGKWRLTSPFLTLPHPHMLRRDFVMIPLRELQPGF